MRVDQNLVTVEWGLVGAFGVAITLLIPKADEYRRVYTRTGSLRSLRDARRWWWVVHAVPVAVVFGIAALSLLGARDVGSSRSRLAVLQVCILVAPLVAQLGFVTMVAILVPRSSPPQEVLPRHQSEPFPPSEPSLDEVAITFVNSLDCGVAVRWIDISGQPHRGRDHVHVVPTGARYTMLTHPFHNWLIETEDGTHLGVVTALERPTTAIVAPDPSSAPQTNRKPRARLDRGLRAGG
jgi:hypothetical protein